MMIIFFFFLVENIITDYFNFKAKLFQMILQQKKKWMNYDYLRLVDLFFVFVVVVKYLNIYI